jgi:hypothetical protein
MAVPLLNASVTAIAGQLTDLASRVQQLERNQRSGYNPQNTSIPGSLTFTGPDGTPAVVVGAQSDGTFTAKQVGTIVPPKAPSTPVVAPGIQGLYVAWDGLMSDGSTPAADFAALQIYVSTSPNFTPGPGTLVGHIVGAGLFGVGNLNPGTTYYVIFLAVNGVGDAGDPSAQASGVPADVPPGNIADGSITAQKIQTGAITSAQIAAAAGILGSQIQTGSITSANILAGTITTALLAAGIVIAGAIDGTVVTGSTLQNSSTDPRTSVNPDGSVSITSNGGTVIFRIGPDGTISWYSPSGALLMTLQPGGTHLIYASLTGPAGWDFEPPGPPALLFSASSAVSSTTYANAPVLSADAGSCVTVIASASGATNVTGVSDNQGNTYTQVQGVTSGVNMSVWQAIGINPLSSHDAITVTFGAANTQEKNIIALATPGVVTTSVTDFSAQANGTSTSATASGTPSFFGDAMLFIVSNASAGLAPTAVTDGWTQIAQAHVATFQYTTAWYSANVNGAAQSATATITSAAWSAVILGLKPSPLMPLPANTITGNNATLTPSTAWAGDGVLSAKITHSNTTTGWGLTTPAFLVNAGTTVSMACLIFTPTALSAVSIGFTFWSNTDGTGSNLGTVNGDQGSLATSASGVYQLSITGATVPAGAKSATFAVLENAGDPLNTVFYVDDIQVPGGLVYSNSPTGGVDTLGNQFPQGISFIGLAGLTNTFSVSDPFGDKLATIDGLGNISGQTISATTDVLVGGASIAQLLVAQGTGVVQRAWTPGTGVWPSTAIGTTETALLEIDFTIPAGHAYMLEIFPADFLTTAAAGIQHVFRLKYTTDGTTPTTTVGGSVSEVAGHSPTIITVSTASKNYVSPYVSWIPSTPGVDTLYRVLLSANLQTAGTFQFQSSSIEMRVTDLGIDEGQFANSGVVLGTGGSGGSGGAQTFTEYFYGNSTWSYYSGGGLRNHNSTLYQGSPSGAGSAWNIGYIQFSVGSLGNNLNTVLNYSVNSVKLRLLNTGTYYNYGMTVGLHSSTVLGSAGYSAFLDFWNIGEGQQLSHTLSSTSWAPWKAGGTTYAVLAPTSPNNTNLNWWGNFWGGGTNNAKVPAMIVNYTH